MDNKLSEIKSMPTCIEKIHQSCFRANAILGHILEMVERGGSKDTIFQTYCHLADNPISVDLETFNKENE
jgi:hypothetical protein